MSTEDQLEGFRAPEQPEYSDAEAQLLTFITEKKGILELINAGLDMERFLSTPKGQALWKRQEEILGESIKQWLEGHDPSSDYARVAHFNARVAVGVLKAFQETIDTGREMGQQLRHSEDDEESSNTGRN